MLRIQSFPPVANRHAETLILGSMPGQASLTAGEYYAHPHNAFWRILGDLLGFDRTAPYAARLRALTSARIALWDVLHSCTREGSLDSAIDVESVIANDFAAFFARHRRITRILFNGGMAEASFRKHVARQIDLASMQLVRLPSTSPAHASLNYEQKREAWRIILPNS